MTYRDRSGRWSGLVVGACLSVATIACSAGTTPPTPTITPSPLASPGASLAPTPTATPAPTPAPTPASTPAPTVVPTEPAPAYQTPGDLLKLDWSIHPTAAGAGFPLTLGMTGYKVMMVRQRLGLSTDGTRNSVDAEMVAAVKAFQRTHGLEIDGIVGPITWASMGYPPASWTELDAYVAPLRTDRTMTRDEHIDALIDEAMGYVGATYVWGGSNAPDHGADCSGMVLQAMYAVGLDPYPIDTVKHAAPTYRTSRELYAHPALLHVPVAERERGDLLFWAEDGRIYHVAIYLGDGRMIEATPPQGRVTSVRLANLRPEAVRLLP